MTTPDQASDSCPLVSRRQFIAGLGATAAVSVTGGWALGLWRGRPEPTGATTTILGSLGQTPEGRTLVIVEMGGGNDGLNMVVPHATSRYHDLRGDLAVTDPIDVDGDIGLHPALVTLAERYGTGELAIVEGVGYPNPELSHFTSMATWWAGDTAGIGTQAGWLGRYLDGTVGNTDPLAAIVIGPGPTPALLADQSFAVTIQDVSGLSPSLPPWMDTRDELMAAWAGFTPAEVDSPGLFGDVQRAIAASATAAAELGKVLVGCEMPARREARSLAGYLDLAARLVTGPTPPRVIYVHGWGDFDTHQGQSTRHAELMGELDGALHAFFTIVGEAGVSDNVLVMTTSEFGRRAASNGAGTDHGTAAPQLLIGSPVAGGRYGLAPDLTHLDRNGNFVHTVDFRSIYASVLDDWLGIDHPEVLGSTFETLGALRT